MKFRFYLQLTTSSEK